MPLDAIPLNIAKEEFFTNAEVREQLFAENEKELAMSICAKWEEVKHLEEIVFKEKSYFRRLRQGLSVEWDRNDPSSNDTDYAHDIPHGGTLEDDDGESVMVGDGSALPDPDERTNNEDEATQRAILASYNIRRKPTATLPQLTFQPPVAVKPIGGGGQHYSKDDDVSNEETTAPRRSTRIATRATIQTALEGDGESPLSDSPIADDDEDEMGEDEDTDDEEEV